MMILIYIYTSMLHFTLNVLYFAIRDLSILDVLKKQNEKHNGTMPLYTWYKQDVMFSQILFIANITIFLQVICLYVIGDSPIDNITTKFIYMFISVNIILTFSCILTSLVTFYTSNIYITSTSAIDLEIQRRLILVVFITVTSSAEMICLVISFVIYCGICKCEEDEFDNDPTIIIDNNPRMSTSSTNIR